MEIQSARSLNIFLPPPEPSKAEQSKELTHTCVEESRGPRAGKARRPFFFFFRPGRLGECQLLRRGASSSHRMDLQCECAPPSDQT